jgi:DNA-binding MarR family transcriptional regulator/GNAT superfamily N-acetyltransferase
MRADPMSGPQPELDDLTARVAAVRRFNRFYTRQVGALAEQHLQSPYPLPVARVLYELGHRDAPTATALAQELELDRGYLSRLLAQLERDGLVDRTPSTDDARQSHIHLTAAGRAAADELDARARREVAQLFAPLPESAQRRLVAAMETVEELLGAPLARGGGPPRAAAPYLLRAHQPGDMGWIVHRHGVLYSAEYGWDERFEALVARVAADFIDHFDATRERCWIAERDGANVGSVFLVRHPDDETAAKLRLLLVEPSARGLGIGRRLVDECTRFARRVGYSKVTLWTNSVLVTARAIYAAAGYRLVRTETHDSFGRELTGEFWELTL